MTYKKNRLTGNYKVIENARIRNNNRLFAVTIIVLLVVMAWPTR